MKHENKTMKDTRLIQRLKKPHVEQTQLTALTNAFAFGGGYRNGGLSEEATALVNKVWTWDYMGAAEYEHGKVPEALAKIFDNVKDFIATEVQTKFGEAYIFCNKDHLDNVVIALGKLLKESAKRRPKDWVRDYVGFDEAMMSRGMTKEQWADKVKELHALDIYVSPCLPSTVGWLELNNGFLFFSDKGMFENAVALMGGKINNE